MAETRVLIGSCLHSSDGCAPRFIDLPDHASELTVPYLVAGNVIQECSVYQSRFASWFIGDSIQQDGSLYLSTPVDVLFLILPALEKAAAGGNFCDLEHVFQCMACSPSAIEAITSLVSHSQLQCVCDTKEAAGQHYYRLSEPKTLAWLRLKVAHTKAALAASHTGFAGMEDIGLTAYAAGLLSEYLSPDWSAKLATSLALPNATAATNGEGSQGQTGGALAGYNADISFDRPPEAKRPRLDPKEAAKAKAAESRAAAKVAKMAKEAAGMRKLSSFFTKK